MLFATHTSATEAKVRKSRPKKALCENRRAEKSVEKMQARGKTCFLQHTRNTTDPKQRKSARMKHTNTTTTPKYNLAPQDDDTR